MADEDLVYAPAKRGNVAVLIMLAGPSGSGKTKSALRLATGLANGGTIGVCDTEHGRAAIYADEFEFQHLKLLEPFTPQRFERAAVISQQAGHTVWICDSFSHEHVGPGGLLDMQEAELKRLTKGDDSKRDALKYTSWIAPKGHHKHLVQRLWQLNHHIILCCHAEKKLDLTKDPKTGRIKPNPDADLSPVCSPDIPYAMTASFLFDARRPGVPIWLKYLDKLAPLVSTERVMDEATGARIGAWARGETPEPMETASRASRPAAAREPPREDVYQNDSTLPIDRPAAQPEDPALLAWVEKTEELFLGSVDRRHHLKLVDDPVDRERIAWLKANRRELYDRTLGPAIKASWARTEPRPPPVTSPAAAAPEPALTDDPL